MRFIYFYKEKRCALERPMYKEIVRVVMMDDNILETIYEWDLIKVSWVEEFPKLGKLLVTTH